MTPQLRTRSLGSSLGSAGCSSGPARDVAPEIPDHQMVRCIGRGSYGEVWLARNTLGTWRAVKVVYRDRFQEVRPFEREFAGIRNYEPVSRTNEGLVDLLHIGRNDTAGYFYYVMELADNASEDGRSLAAATQEVSANCSDQYGAYVPKTLASEIRARGGVLPVGECVTLGMTLCLALGHLHRNGLLHRDVKPSNIIFVNSVPKLADIGLVAGLGEARSFVGTEGFIPPEGPNSPQADLFALGKVLYEASMGKDRNEFPEPRSRIGVGPDSSELMELNAVLLRACAPRTEDRYRSAEQMNADLALLNSGQSIREKHRLESRVKFLTRAGLAILAVVGLGAFPYFIAIKEAQLARAAAREKAQHAARADRETKRARAAEAEALTELWRSYVNEAQAQRFSTRFNRRAEALSAVRKAAAINPSLEVRNEAIACLALPDVCITRVWNSEVDGAGAAVFDERYERYVFSPPAGQASLRRTADHSEIMPLPELDRPEPPVEFTVKFSPDGRFVAAVSGTSQARVLLWDLKERRLVQKWEGRRCRTLEFSPDSLRLAVCLREDELRRFPVEVYDLPRRQVVLSFDHGICPLHVRFHPYRNLLATTGNDGNEVWLWNLETGTREPGLVHPRSVSQVAWNPEGELLACGCEDNHVYIWDVASRTHAHLLSGHSGFPREVSFSSDGQFLASRGWDGILNFWDPWNGQCVFRYPVVGFTSGFSHTGMRYGFGPGRGEQAYFELEPSRECRSLRPGPTFKARGQNCDFGQDDNCFLTAHEDGVRLWDLTAGRVQKFLPNTGTLRALFSLEPDRILVAGEMGLAEWTLSRNASGGWLAVIGQDPISNLLLDDLVRCRSGHTLAFSAGTDLRLLNLTTRTLTAVPWGAGAPAQARTWLTPTLSPDERLLACGAVDSENLALPIRIFSTADGQCIQQLPTLGADGTRTLFSPNGRWLLTGDNLEYGLWDVATWRKLYGLPRGDVGYAAFMAFSPDSTVMALALTRDTVRLVETSSRRELATLMAPQASDIYHLTFNRDGTRLAVMYRNGPVHLWDLRLIRAELAALNLGW